MNDFVPPFLQIDLQITGRCNSRCKFCNSWKNNYPHEDDIPAKIWVETVKQLAGFTDIEYICIGGGEPLLYKDLYEVLSSLSKLNLNVVVVSNGSLFSQETCLRLKDTGIKSFDFSIDGFENTHDELRGSPGLFKKCVESIYLLKKIYPEISIGISTLICERNIYEIQDFLNWALRELPIDRINFQAYQQVTDYREGRWWENNSLWPKDQRLITSTMEFLSEKARKETRITNHHIQFEKYKNYFIDPDSNLNILCPAGSLNFSISYNGDIIGCISKGPIGNITCQDPIQIYREQFPAVRKKAVDCHENCHFLINCYFPLHWSRWNDIVENMVRQDEGHQYKSGKRILPPEIREITSSEHKEYPDLIKYEEHKELDIIGKISNLENRKFPKHYPEKIPCIYLCGDDSETHRWSVGLDENDYYKQIEQLKILSAKKSVYHTIIGVSRTNFFKLHKVLLLVRKLRAVTADNTPPAFSLCPLKNIKNRFSKHLNELSKIGKWEGVEFRIIDDGLYDLFDTIERNVRSGSYAKNDMLRVLGPVCKNVFIGPKYMLLDISGKCNLDCVYCRKFSEWNKDYWKNRSIEIKGFMDFYIINNILLEAKKIGVETLLLVGGSEPTLHPEFIRIIKLIKQLGLKFNFSTNGTLLERYSNNLIDGSCQAVTVSLSFASEETFKKIRPNSLFQLKTKIDYGVKKLSELKKLKNIHTPKIHALFALCKYNYHEIIPMVEFAKDLRVDSIWFQMVHLEDFSRDKLKISPDKIRQVKEDLKIAKKLCQKYKIEFDTFIDFEIDCFNEENGDWSKGGLIEQGCFVGWNFAFVALKNEVFFCCGARTVGFLNSEGEGLKDLWFSDVYKRYRNDGLIMHKENPLCLYGRSLYDNYCNSCDNHDQNNMMIDMLNKYGLLKFVQR